MGQGNQTTVPLSVFIISWAGRHEDALSICQSVLHGADDVSIVYSDPDPGLVLNAACKLIQRPNDLFWEDKLKACLDACGNKAMLVIHADCKCDDWALLVESYKKASFKLGDMGVWAPRIHGTPFDLAYSKISKIKNSNLNIAALTDAIVFALSPEIVSRMRMVRYGSNPMGWGTAGLFCAAAHVMNKLVVIDETVDVQHPQGTGYDTDLAIAGMQKFMSEFSNRECIEFMLLKSHVELNRLKFQHSQPK